MQNLGSSNIKGLLRTLSSQRHREKPTHLLYRPCYLFYLRILSAYRIHYIQHTLQQKQH